MNESSFRVGRRAWSSRVGAAGAAVALGAVLALGCRVTPEPAPRVTFTLGDGRLARTDALLPFNRFDGERGSLLTGIGWSRPGPTGDPAGVSEFQVEAVALNSELLLPAPPPGLHDLLLRCAPYRPGATGTLRVEAWAADALLASADLPPEWATTRLPLPDRIFDAGSTRIELRFGDLEQRNGYGDFRRRDRPHWAACSLLALVPHDLDRPLEALERLVAPGASARRLPGAAHASVAFPIPPGAELELEVRASGLPEDCAPEVGLRARGTRAFDPIARLAGALTVTRVRNDGDLPAEVLLRVSAHEVDRSCPPEGGMVEVLRLERVIAPGPRPRPQPNVLFYLIDTLRADAPELAERTSQALRRFARSGVRYRLAWSPSSWTLPAVASLFTGALPVDHGLLRWDARLPSSGATTLAERFGSLGYQTLALSQTWLVGPDFGLERGFDDYLLNDQFNGQELRSQELRALLAHWYLASWDPARPLFAYFHSVDPHGPYSPPPGRYRELRQAVAGGRFENAVRVRDIERPEAPLAEADRDAARALYLGEVEFADEQFGLWLDALAWLALDDGALVALLSDHGEAFGEADRFGHGRDLGEEQTRVPLLVRFPDGLAGGSESTEPVSTLDLVASALALAGERGADGYLGRRGLPRTAGSEARTADAEVRPIGPEEERGILLRALLLGETKCLLATGVEGRPLADLPTWRHFRLSPFDVLERPGSPDDADADRCRRALRAALVARPRPGAAAEVWTPDAEQVETLRAVGYL